MDEHDIYTGQLKYQDIDFTFILTGEELRLIPSKDKSHEIEWEWGMKELANGVYTFGELDMVEDTYLIGDCNETGGKIVFITKLGSYVSKHNAILFIELVAYVVCKFDRESIDKISITCPEINCIHPVNQAVNYAIDSNEYINTGVATLTTQNFDATTTEAQTFIIDGKEAKMHFGISRSISAKILEPPLSVMSTLIFEFEETKDYEFIYRLWVIARNFIRFLCYRKNISIPSVELSAPYENGKHERFATMYVLNQKEETEVSTLKKGRYIKQALIAGQEGKILNDIAANNIYLRHLPETYQAGKHIDAARFVMITAAFEWEFKRVYPDGIKKSEKRINAEDSAINELKRLIDTSTGEKKEIYKFLKKLIRSNSLKSEIIQVGKDLSAIIDVFGNHLYRLNNHEFNYSDIGQRLSDQRNNFAHGNLDKEFVDWSLLDLLFIERIIYALQLKQYGIDDKNIQKSINDLFSCHIAL